MTTAIGTLATQGSGSGVREVREKGAAPAPAKRTSGAEGSEFAAMLLIAGVGVARNAPAKDVGAKAGVGQAHPQGEVGRGGAAKASGKGQDGASGGATAIASRALAQSQADELRTVGKGVSLKAIAQAELRGEGAGGGGASAAIMPSDGARPANRSELSQGASGPDGPGAGERSPSGRQVGHQATDAGQVSSANSTATPARAAQTSSAASAGASVAMASLDRLTRAHERALPMPGRAVASAGPMAALMARAVGQADKAGLGMTPPGNAGHGGAIGRAVDNGGHSAAGGSGVASKAGSTQASSQGTPSKATESAPPAFAGQVHRALGQALQSRDGVVTIHLTPEHLGRLRVDVSREEGGGVRATFEAQSPQARGLLERAMPELKAALEARGIHVEGLDVRLAPSQEQSDAERPSGDPGSRASGEEAPKDSPGDSPGHPQEWGGHGERPRGDSNGDDGGGGPRRQGGLGEPLARGTEPVAVVNGALAESGFSLSTIEVVA